jgi:hypothetical protein
LDGGVECSNGVLFGDLGRSFLVVSEGAKMKAFRVNVGGISGIACGRSPGNARYTVFQSANDSGYKTSFADIQIKRSPEYDTWAESMKRPEFWSENFVQSFKPKEQKQ